MKKNFRKFVILFLSVFFIFPAAAQRTYTIKKTLPKAVVISPVEGSFSNYQALILSVPDDCNAFYSFTGSDPLISGFAYDSPVIIERNGDITLRIATVSKNNESTEQVIHYSVELSPVEQKFYTESLTNPLILLNSSNPLLIPENMVYCVGDYDEPYIPGRKLQVEKNNGLDRIMSISIKDDTRLYRIMVNMTEENKDQNPSQLPKRTEETEIVPFIYTCSNWSDFSFELAEDTVFSIDGQECKNNPFDIVLDRTHPHIFSWSETASGNSGSLVLPPKPEIIKLSEKAGISGAIDLYISDPRYTFTTATAPETVPHFTKCHIDTIYGDDLAGTLDYKVYYDGIYQGNLSVTLALDKKPPKKPIFVADGINQKYERKPVKLSVQSDGQVFYRISFPVKSDFGFNDNYETDFKHYAFDENPESFEKYLNVPLQLKGSRDGAAYYYIEAYAQDYAGNKSEVATYATVIDPYNFYVTAGKVIGENELQDGSPSHPFTDINRVFDIVNDSGNFVRIHLDGEFLNCKSINVRTECEIIASDGSSIELAEGEAITVDKAKLKISNLVIENNSLKAESDLTPKTAELTQMLQKNLITVNQGSLFLDKCEIIGLLGINGSLINLQNSVLEIKDCGLTAKAKNYTAVISGINVDSEISNARFTSIGDTAVVLSVNRGSLSLQNSVLNVFSQMGRACELTRLDYKIKSNVFNTVSKNPVWADKRCSRISFENNTFNVIDVSVQNELYETEADLKPVKTDTDKSEQDDKLKTDWNEQPEKSSPHEYQFEKPVEETEQETSEQDIYQTEEVQINQLDAEPETKTDTETEAELEPDLITDTEAEAESSSDSETEVKLETETEAEENAVEEISVETEQKSSEPDLNLAEDVQINQTELEFDQITEMEADTKDESETETDMDTETGSDHSSESETETEEIIPEDATETESFIDSSIPEERLDEEQYLFTEDELSDLLKDFLLDVDAK